MNTPHAPHSAAVRSLSLALALAAAPAWAQVGPEASAEIPAPSAVEAPSAAAPSPVEPPSAAAPSAAAPSAAAQVAAEPDLIDDPRLRLSVRGGRRYPWDAGHEALYEQPAGGRLDLQLDVRLHDVWWVGVGWQSGSESGTVYQDWATALSQDTLRAHALYRRPLGDVLAVTGRGGLALWFTELTVGDHADEQIHPGLFVGLGLEFLPLNPRLQRELGSFSLGLVLEVLYDQVLATEHTFGGTPLGSLDASGFGWSLGVVSSF